MLIVGTGGDDTLIGTVDDDVIQGLGGNDLIDGIAGNDQLEGGDGNDVYKIRDPDTIIVELSAQGTDIAYAFVSYVLTSGAHVELLTTYQISATDAIDLTGNELVNTLWGNNGSNVLRGGGGADTLIGFGGNDTYYVTEGSERLLESAGGGTDIAFTSVSYGLEAGSAIELLSTDSIAGTGAINLTGNELTQTLWGNQGANQLRSGGGGDTMNGFGGDDIYYVSGGSERIIENAGEGTDSVYASVSFALNAGAAVELLSTESIAGTGAINLTGNEYNNTIWGNQGANTLNGGAGVDAMVGFGGDDIYVVDTPSDVVIEEAGQGNDTIQTSSSYTLGAGNSIENIVVISAGGGFAFNVVLTGNEIANNITGGPTDEFIFGGGGNDILNGGTAGGRDVLDGGTGADQMTGGSGNDTYYVDNEGDSIFEASNGGLSDVVYASASYTLTAGAAIELLSTISIADTTAIDLKGNELANNVWGNSGANVLDGGAGADNLTGFGGADTFAFTTALGGGNIDIIYDYQSGVDRIGLDDAIFTGLAPGALSASAFVVGTAAADADDRIIYDSATGRLFFDADGNGAGAAVQFALLEGKPPLTWLDFTVI
jgi:Ca2+-binding RTX toxin-like protein